MMNTTETRTLKTGKGQLLTKAILKRTPKLYATEGTPADDKVIQFKLFGGSACTWLIVELDPNTGEAFGWCDIGHGSGEWGYVSLHELAALRFPPFGLGVERDLYFKPQKFSETFEYRRAI